MLNRRAGSLTRQVGTETEIHLAQNYTVIVTPVGAVVATTANSTTITVEQGHSFVARDRFLRNPGTDNQLSGTVSSVTVTTIVMEATWAVNAGDVLVNLGPDGSAGATPNYDAIPTEIFSDPDGGTRISGSALTTTSAGNYGYWCRGDGAFWELIFDSLAAPVGVIQGWGAVPGRLNVADYGAIGDGAVVNTLRLQQTIDVAEASGAAVFFPVGTFVSAALTIETPIAIRGASPYNSVLACNAATGNLLRVALTTGAWLPVLVESLRLTQVTNALNSGAALLNVDGTTAVVLNLCLRDVYFRSNFDTSLCASGTAIALKEVNGAKLYNVHIQGNDGFKWGVGLDIGNACTANRGNVSMFGGHIGRCTTGVRIAKDSGVELVNNVQLYDCKLVYSGSGAQVDGIGVQAFANAKNVTLDACQFEGYDLGVDLQEPSVVRVVGCSFVNANNAAGTYKTGLRVTGPTQYLTVNNNRFAVGSGGTTITIADDASIKAIQIYGNEMTSGAAVADSRAAGNVDDQSFAWLEGGGAFQQMRVTNTISNRIGMILKPVGGASDPIPAGQSPSILLNDAAGNNAYIRKEDTDVLAILDNSAVAKFKFNTSTGKLYSVDGYLAIKDTMAASPSGVAGECHIYVDATTGDLMVQFGTDTPKLLLAD